MNLRLSEKVSASTIAVLLITIIMTTTVFASPLSESKNQLNSSKKLYNETIKRIENLEREIEKFDSEIEGVLIKIDELNKSIIKSRNSIENTKEEIEVIKSNITKEEKIFGERMNALYVNGTTSYIDVLLESKDFNDFITRIDTVKTIIEYDKEIMQSLDSQKVNLSSKKQAFEKEQESLIALQKKNNENLKVLNENKKEQNNVIANLKYEKNKYALEISNHEKEIARKIEDARKSQEAQIKRKAKENQSSAKTNDSNINSPSRGNVSSTGLSVVNYARRFLGIPYVWGGKSPSPGFDCSGLTAYVYRNSVGISIPGYSVAQSGVGKTVSRGELQPGDLVFFGSPTHHVGIYSGGGNYIHAPQTGDVVKEVPMNRSDFTHGKRIL